MLIVDSQVHIWELSTPDRPWPSGRLVPAWAFTPFSADQLLAEMDEGGIDRAVLVPAAFAGDDNSLALAAVAEHQDRFAIMGLMPVDDIKSPFRMRRWMEIPGVLGLRFSFLTDKMRQWLVDGTAEWIWPTAESLGVPLMVLPPPEFLPELARIAARYPGVRLTLDHLGIGHEQWRRDDRAFEHMDALRMLARCPNVAVKASCVPAYSTHQYPYRNMFPYVRQIIDEFGPRRVFWGTDFTRLPCTYRQAVAMFTEEMDWLSAADLEWILGRGISEWLNWPI
jgi:L-fuconolactonase